MAIAFNTEEEIRRIPASLVEISRAIQLLATAVGELQSPESRTEREGTRCESPGFVTRLNAAAEYLRAEEASRLGSARPTEEKRLREALQGLVDRLEEIDEKSNLTDVFFSAANHHVPYEGPSWVAPLEAARAALAPKSPESGTQPTQEKES